MRNLREYYQFINENQRYSWAGNLTEEDFKRLYGDDDFTHYLNLIYVRGMGTSDVFFAEIGRHIEQKLNLHNNEFVQGAPPNDRYRRLFQTWMFGINRHDLIDMFGDPYYWTDREVCFGGEGLWLNDEDRNLGTDPDFIGCSWFITLGGVMVHIFVDDRGPSLYFKINESEQGTKSGLEKTIGAFKALIDVYVRKADWEKLFN